MRFKSRVYASQVCPPKGCTGTTSTRPGPREGSPAQVKPVVQTSPDEIQCGDLQDPPRMKMHQGNCPSIVHSMSIRGKGKGGIGADRTVNTEQVDNAVFYEPIATTQG